MGQDKTLVLIPDRSHHHILYILGAENFAKQQRARACMGCKSAQVGRCSLGVRSATRRVDVHVADDQSRESWPKNYWRLLRRVQRFNESRRSEFENQYSGRWPNDSGKLFAVLRSAITYVSVLVVDPPGSYGTAAPKPAPATAV